MGLKDMLINLGSPYSYGNGVTPTINVLATAQSQLHADGNTPGYSLDGSDFQDVNTAYQSYNDGYSNALPMPSNLDLNGVIPPRYIDNLPG